MHAYDVIVVGGGMAGASIGFELAADRRVLLVEMERALAFHTTGRSAAMFLETYGSPEIRGLTTASRSYLENPPGHRLLSPLPMLYIARAGHGPALAAMYREVRALAPDVVLLDVEEAVALQPVLRPERLELALIEPGAMEIDVHAMHQDYVRGLRARGGEIATSARLEGAARDGAAWRVELSDGRAATAPVVVDAAGAWADEVAVRLGAAPAGLRALRRTAFMVASPNGVVEAPMIADVDDAFYLKPDTGRLLCSPADETPQQPADARPDEVEIARAIEVMNEVTTLGIRHVLTSWAGLRTFAPDRNPVVGYDPVVEGLFWFAGQGGYGIQTAPALARTGAALARGESLPADVAERGVTAHALAPGRAFG